MVWPEDTLIAGDPALDFLNTAGGADKTREPDRLQTWEDAIAFAGATDLVDPGEARNLADLPTANAVRELEGLRELRENLYGELRVCAGATYIPGLALPVLDRRLAEVLATASLRGRGDRFEWDVDVEDMGSGLLAARVLLAAERLLTQGRIKRLRECGRCSWLFLDTSRGRGRRWCRMDACGNRNKAQRYRTRHAE